MGANEMSSMPLIRGKHSEGGKHSDGESDDDDNDFFGDQYDDDCYSD